MQEGSKLVPCAATVACGGAVCQSRSHGVHGDAPGASAGLGHAKFVCRRQVAQFCAGTRSERGHGPHLHPHGRAQLDALEGKSWVRLLCVRARPVSEIHTCRQTQKLHPRPFIRHNLCGLGHHLSLLLLRFKFWKHVSNQNFLFSNFH